MLCSIVDTHNIENWKIVKNKIKSCIVYLWEMTKKNLLNLSSEESQQG